MSHSLIRTIFLLMQIKYFLTFLKSKAMNLSCFTIHYYTLANKRNPKTSLCVWYVCVYRRTDIYVPQCVCGG